MSRLVAPPATRARMSGRIRHSEPPLRPVPGGRPYTEFVTADGRRVFVHAEVLAELAALEREHHPDESAGLLFGRAFTDGTRQCALVRHLIRPQSGEVVGTPATVTITAEGSSRMSRRAQAMHPCADAVGWAHTHPTFGAYFSGTDRAEQAVWTSPASVGLVVSGLDGADPPFEVFVGPESSPTRVAGRPPWAPALAPDPSRRGDREADEPVAESARLVGPAPPVGERSGVPTLGAGRPNGTIGTHVRRRPLSRRAPGVDVAARRRLLVLAAACVAVTAALILAAWLTAGGAGPSVGTVDVTPQGAAGELRSARHAGGGLARGLPGATSPAAARTSRMLWGGAVEALDQASRRVGTLAAAMAAALAGAEAGDGEGVGP